MTHRDTYALPICFGNVPVGVEFCYADRVYCRLNQYEADTVNYPSGDICRFAPNDVVTINHLDYPRGGIYELPAEYKREAV